MLYCWLKINKSKVSNKICVFEAPRCLALKILMKCGFFFFFYDFLAINIISPSWAGRRWKLSGPQFAQPCCSVSLAFLFSLFAASPLFKLSVCVVCVCQYAGRLGFPHPGGDNPLPINGMYTQPLATATDTVLYLYQYQSFISILSFQITLSRVWHPQSEVTFPMKTWLCFH